MFEPNQEVYILQNRYADIQKPRLRRSKKERQIICACCGKHFYQSEEGFVGGAGLVICSDCHHKSPSAPIVTDNKQ